MVGSKLGFAVPARKNTWQSTRTHVLALLLVLASSQWPAHGQLGTVDAMPCIVPGLAPCCPRPCDLPLFSIRPNWPPNLQQAHEFRACQRRAESRQFHPICDLSMRLVQISDSSTIACAIY